MTNKSSPTPASRKFKQVAVKQYKIKYKDGRTQEVEANSTTTTKEFIFFEKNGDWVLQVAADSVESFGLADVPEAKRPAPRSVGV